MAEATARERRVYSEAQRMELRSLVHVAGEAVSPFWPMRTFIHHNPLHGLEDLEFEEAVERGRQLLGGQGSLPSSRYREYVRRGRILEKHLDAVLQPLATEGEVEAGGRRIAHREVLRVLLYPGLAAPPAQQVQALWRRDANRRQLDSLSERLTSVIEPRDLRHAMLAAAHGDRAKLAQQFTLSDWCDRVLGTHLKEFIDQQLIKWCAVFLDEGHATWEMPLRDQAFYRAWRVLSQSDFTGWLAGISDWPRLIAELPERAEDAVLESLDGMGIPKSFWADYLSLHATALPGWGGLIQWRASHSEDPWQHAYPINLVKLLAVRLVHERALVEQACRESLGIDGTFIELAAWTETNPGAYFLCRGRTAGSLPPAVACRVDQALARSSWKPTLIQKWAALAESVVSEWAPESERTEKLLAAWRLRALASALALDFEQFVKANGSAFRTLLTWMDQFPETKQGPCWLRALELGYQDELVHHLMPQAARPSSEAEAARSSAPPRPFAQSLYCIDVRSECLRRHLEQTGDHETYGIAGFFGVPIRYQPFGGLHQLSLCPVLVKPKHVVREIPRAYQGEAAQKHLAMARLIHAGTGLLHDLKENVITPYVMVEAVGWFFALPFVGRTLMPRWYRRVRGWLGQRLAMPVGTTLTVDKLSRQEAYEMAAVEQRTTIRLVLRERLGPAGARVPSEFVERLRRSALEENGGGSSSASDRGGLSEADYDLLIDDLRHKYDLTMRSASQQLNRITHTGLTPSEQLLFVETALRLIGLTRNFARLVLLCGHGSTSDNNPYESALDCGACGGNHGGANARLLTAMANKVAIREQLAKRGIVIPQDTQFLAGQHDTTTDEVRLFDLEDVPPTHRHDLSRLIKDLEEAAGRVRQERCARLPDVNKILSPERAWANVMRRRADWMQVRPEWGLSRHGAMVIGRRVITKGLNLEGRSFLHSYDHAQDQTGKLLEIIMTAPLVVAQWINMEHYFSTVDNEVYGSGSKAYHNVVGRVGVMFGTQSDLRIGLPWQTVMDGDHPFHEPMRLVAVIEAPRDRITSVIRRNGILQRLFGLRWVHLLALDPEAGAMFRYSPEGAWQQIHRERTVVGGRPGEGVQQ